MEFEKCSEREQGQDAVGAHKRHIYASLEIDPKDEHWRAFGVCRVGELGEAHGGGGWEYSR